MQLLHYLVFANLNLCSGSFSFLFAFLLWLYFIPKKIFIFFFYYKWFLVIFHRKLKVFVSSRIWFTPNSQVCLSTATWNISHNIFQQGGRFFSRGSHPSQTHPWTWKTDTSNRQHAAHRGKFSQRITPWLWAERGCGSRKERPWPRWLVWLLQRGDLHS